MLLAAAMFLVLEVLTIALVLVNINITKFVLFVKFQSKINY